MLSYNEEIQNPGQVSCFNPPQLIYVNKYGGQGLKKDRDLYHYNIKNVSNFRFQIQNLNSLNMFHFTRKSNGCSKY
ncbi:hypothetical protein RIR_jg23688.t1 [Rhizophagus irregularis DAOM 181602=DAOM 197198]|nr:hypothetical protein RIR_jg23688.t1 [Rhizophagus irregularis DAOM 181602=DAOM 197198]